MNNRPKLTLTRKNPGFALCLMCSGPAVWFAEYEPVDLTLCDGCYEAVKRYDEPDALDKAVTALRHQLGADDENFVCTDIDGVEHDLSPPGAVTTSPVSPRGRIIASMPAIGLTNWLKKALRLVARAPRR